MHRLSLYILLNKNNFLENDKSISNAAETPDCEASHEVNNQIFIWSLFDILYTLLPDIYFNTIIVYDIFNFL